MAIGLRLGGALRWPGLAYKAAEDEDEDEDEDPEAAVGDFFRVSHS